jgi:hypothetical protein
MAKLSRDQAPGGNLHPRENLLGTGIFASAGAEIIINVDGCSVVMLDLRGIYSLTVEVAASVDGINWVPIPLRPINQASKLYLTSIVGTTQGIWAGGCAGFREVRARVVTWVSGAASTTLMASNALLEQGLEGLITPAFVTATAAAGAALTVSIPSPGVGLRNYLSYLLMARFATAALTAAAAPVTVTTTNLPGALAFLMPADAALQGTLFVLNEQFDKAIASSAQNTATTIVLPATTGVIWRATAGYYVAP